MDQKPHEILAAVKGGHRVLDSIQQRKKKAAKLIDNGEAIRDRPVD
jgi:hypothetical protein